MAMGSSVVEELVGEVAYSLAVASMIAMMRVGRKISGDWDCLNGNRWARQHLKYAAYIDLCCNLKYDWLGSSQESESVL